MKKSLSSLLTIAAVIVTSPSYGAADDSPRTVLLSGQTGVFVPSAAERLKTSPMVGIKLGTPVTDLISIEGGLDFIPSSTGGRASNLAQFEFDFLYKTFDSGPWSILAAVGGGGIVGGGGTKSGPMMDFGVEARYFLSEHLALRSDLRDVIASESIGNNIEFTVGATYFFEFGSTRAKVSPQSRHLIQPPEAATSVQAAPVRALAEDVPITTPPPAAASTKDTKVKLLVPAPVAAGKDAPVVIVSADPFPAALVTSTPLPEKARVFTTVDAPPVDAQLMLAATESETPLVKGKGGSSESSALDQVSSTAPVASAPVASAPVASAPVASAPVASAPVASAPVPATVTPAQPPAAPDKPALAAPSSLTVYFEVNSSKIRNEDQGSLNAIADSLRQSADATAVVEGHSDSSGKLAYNFKLSHRRAANLRRYLVKRGVRAQRLTLINHGSMRPVADNRTKKGRSKNRRAVVKVTVPKRLR